MKQTLTILLLTMALFAQTITLPAPATEGGLPLYEALKNRKTDRSFDNTKELTDKQLSQILWAAQGVNRDKKEKRTAPTAWGNNEIDLYVLLKKGTYRFDAENHSLILVSKEDIREFGGIQDFVKDAPVTIVMVADMSKISQVKDEPSKMAVSQMDAGYVSQNIYLASASEGLVTGARAMIDKKKLGELLKLSASQRVILANSVGYGK